MIEEEQLPIVPGNRFRKRLFNTYESNEIKNPLMFGLYTSKVPQIPKTTNPAEYEHFFDKARVIS